MCVLPAGDFELSWPSLPLHFLLHTVVAFDRFLGTVSLRHVSHVTTKHQGSVPDYAECRSDTA